MTNAASRTLTPASIPPARTTRTARTTARAPLALWVVRLAGLFQVATGLLFWTGNAYALIPLHMLSGLTVVIGLWVLAVSSARAGVGLPLVGGGIAWGVLVIALGVLQGGLLRGDLHWIVQVAHLLVGLAAMALAHALAAMAHAPRAAAGRE
jgi:hypothetical protein